MNPNFPIYKLVECDQPRALEILVEVELLNGYVCLGGIATYYDQVQNQARYVQAMVLSSKVDPEIT